MKLNKSYSSPTIARRNTNNKPPEQKKTFGQQPSPIQTGNNGRRKKQRHKKKEDIDLSLESSHQARSVCASQIKRLRSSMVNFDKYTHAMNRKEAREKRKRNTALAKLRNSRKGTDKTLYKQILEPPSKQRNHKRLVKKMINVYKDELEKVWDKDGGVSWGEKNGRTFTFLKGERGSWIGKKIGFGSDEMYQGENMYTDIAAVAKRNIDRWEKMPYRQAFDSSGPRIPAVKLKPNDTVDTIGMQIRQTNLYWKGRNKGVKFHDVPRDTMAFTKTMERGSDKINSPRSTLDKSQTYWFPFKCTDERFPEHKFQYDTSGKEYKPKYLGTAMEEDDPDYYSSDDDEITIIQKTIPAHERTNSMALSALKAKLKGPSSSFKDKCGRLNPTLTEVYPDLGWNFTIMKDEEHWSKNGCSIKTGPSGREDENVFKPRYGCLGTIIMKEPRTNELKRDLHMNSPLILNDTAAKIYKDLEKKKKLERLKRSMTGGDDDRNKITTAADMIANERRKQQEERKQEERKRRLSIDSSSSMGGMAKTV